MIRTRRHHLLAAYVLSAGALWSGCQQQAASAPGDSIVAGQQLVELMAKGEFASVVKTFAPNVKQALPADKLKEAWEAAVAQVGAFKQQTGARIEPGPRVNTVVVTCEFEKISLDIRIVFNAAGQVARLNIAPSAVVAEYEPPGYVQSDAFTEKEVVVGSGEWAAPGTLSVPKGEGPFPGLVLVHGSGSQDRDETIGPNKPFRDLAWGLASRGVAVLRYEKRTKEHGAKFGPIADRITVKEESVDDAVAAAELLRNSEGVDAKRVFVLGHSLGGMVIPRIGKAAPDLAGLIVMAGTTRKLEDVVLDQYSYIFWLDGAISDEEKAELEKLEAQAARVKDPKLSGDVPAADLPLGLPAAYWLDLRGYDPPKLALELNCPMLILQGGRDYQVTMADYEGWKDALSDREGVTFKLYPKLNHLMIAGEGKSTPGDYAAAGHVAEVVVEDIAGWVKGQPGPARQ